MLEVRGYAMSVFLTQQCLYHFWTFRMIWKAAMCNINGSVAFYNNKKNIMYIYMHQGRKSYTCIKIVRVKTDTSFFVSGKLVLNDGKLQMVDWMSQSGVKFDIFGFSGVGFISDRAGRRICLLIVPLMVFRLQQNL